MLITLTGGSEHPLYVQLTDAFRRKIGAGELNAGDILPAARTLAAALDMNVHTVLRAYQELRDEGLVDLKRGRGAVVTSTASKLAELDEGIARLVQHAHTLGITPKSLASMVSGAETHNSPEGSE